MNVYAVKIPEELSDYEFANYLKGITNERKEELVNNLDRTESIRSLFGILLIQQVLYEKGININNISFCYNDYGKPFLYGQNTVHFNISHSGEWVVCATDILPIGIDIEKIKPIDLKIAKLFFSKEEYEFIKSMPNRTKLFTFYEYWTLKESYVKAVGKGLSIPLDSFSILNNKDMYFLKGEHKSKYYFYQPKFNECYALALCTQNSVRDFKITYFKYKNLIH
ncbi:4'-phosphopantetheinyl transferase family protein [Virgibacillus chiguensis]|uniref:4'-phosphopantetheinyl transferase n=1 Tax=Virgibacillus chiguensis TaxID=411959 RepID=A0A1M5V9J3_9BACI|nr:4'-phosphopantetheinyl transferase superfamily protein [Virgibacillus chiguensis]SHH71942.1 4'-phosphopantetheinyl transferase [Virgibacillus chiguensis]